VLTRSGDKTARLWDAATGQELRAVKGREDAVFSDAVISVAFSPDGKLVLTGSEDKTARLWDAESLPPGYGQRTEKYLQSLAA
jgi:WD40 repeat protein